MKQAADESAEYEVRKLNREDNSQQMSACAAGVSGLPAGKSTDWTFAKEELTPYCGQNEKENG